MKSWMDGASEGVIDSIWVWPKNGGEAEGGGCSGLEF